jgi:glycosyltransferase involved in cell wall biosynthesis
MRVYFRPLLLGGNPYTRELVSALEAEGIEVCGPDRGGMLFAPDFLAKGADVLHLHWLWGSTRGLLVSSARLALLLAQLLLLRALGRAIVFTAHNLRPHESSTPRLDRFCTRSVIGLAHRTIVHGDSAKEVLRRDLGLGQRSLAKLVTIPHAHYADVYPDHVSQAEARRTLEIDEGHFVFGNLGMLRPYKGISALVDAFRSIEGNDLVLVIAGRPVNAAYRAEIEARVAGDPRVRFLPGFVEEDAVQTYLKASDVMVYPFEEVLSSGSVILALSLARTCVCPEVGCIRDITSADDAYLYAPDEPGALREALLSAIADRENSETKGRRCLERALTWTWKDCGRQTADVYRSLTGRAAPPQTVGAAG